MILAPVIRRVCLCCPERPGQPLLTCKAVAATVPNTCATGQCIQRLRWSRCRGGGSVKPSAQPAPLRSLPISGCLVSIPERECSTQKPHQYQRAQNSRFWMSATSRMVIGRSVPNGGSARGYQPVLRMVGPPEWSNVRVTDPCMLSFPAGISTFESTWVACYDWCLR